MPHRDRPKLPLLVLAAGGILLGAAALQSVLITVPGPSSSPHAISVDSGRPAGVAAPSPAPVPRRAAGSAKPADPITTGAVPDPPAGHATDPARPASPPEAASAGAEPQADVAPKDEPQSAVPVPSAAEPEVAPDTGAPAKLESAGSETPSQPREACGRGGEGRGAASGVRAAAATRPLAARHVTGQALAPAPAPPPPEIEAVAAEPGCRPVPAPSEPAAEPAPAQAVQSKTVEGDACARAFCFIARDQAGRHRARPAEA